MSTAICNMYNKAVTYTPHGYVRRRRLKKYISPPITSFDVRKLTKAERACLISVLLINYLIVASILSLIIYSSLSASSFATDNTLTEQLISGTFDTRDEINNSASVFFTKIAGGVFSFALPFMSAFALTMITLSLVSSIIYLSKPDFFDEVNVLVRERKGNKGGKSINDFVEYYRQKGLRDFVLSYCIDFKTWAFQDAVTAGIDGTPTFQDFVRNMPKYILMFTFCILITNRVLLDFLMTGAKLCARVAEKVTYDYDYVSILENFMDMGDRYVPQQWTGKSRENSNLMQTYRAIYNTVIAQLEPEQKDTESLQHIGMNIEQYIVDNIMPKEHWDRKVFSAKAEYIPVRKTNVEAPGTYYIPGETLGMVSASGSPGYIMLYIRSESDDKAFANASVTRYPGGWSNEKPPKTFNITAIPGIPTASNGARNVEYIITGGTVLAVTADGQAYNGTVTTDSTGKITINYNFGNQNDVSSRIATVTISGLKIKVKTTLNGKDSRITDFNTFDKPVWVNPNPVTKQPSSQNK